MSEEEEHTEIEETEHIKPAGDYIMLPTSKILIPETRMTSSWSEEEKASLIESIRENGILQPLTVIFNEGDYYVVDGFNRLMCAQILDMQEVPCIVQERALDDVYFNNLIINMLKGKSNPNEIGEVLSELVNNRGYTLTDAAKKCSLSEVQARKYLKLTELPLLIREYVALGRLGIEHAYLISQLDEEEQMIEAANRAVEWSYNTYQLKDCIKSMKEPDRELEAGDYFFDDLGQPQIVYPKCPYCLKEVHPETQRTIVLHSTCKVELDQVFKEMHMLEAQQAHAQELQAPPPVQEPPVQPLPQPPQPPQATPEPMQEPPAQDLTALLNALDPSVLDALAKIGEQVRKRKLEEKPVGSPPSIE